VSNPAGDTAVEDQSGTEVLLLVPGAGNAVRVPVLTCLDALRRGATVTVIEASSDSEVDLAVSRAIATPTRLVVAGGDGPLRAVLRRMVRRAVPRGGERPAGLRADRTIADLPPIGILPLEPASPIAPDLVTMLGLPRDPDAVAAAVLAGRSRRLDLLRNDGGSVTLRSALIGGVDASGQPIAWSARIDVDDTVLSDGSEQLLACGIGNTGRIDAVPGLTLVANSDPADGSIEVGVAVPLPSRLPDRLAGRLPDRLRSRGRSRGQIEVRRARGRAVAVTLTGGDVPFTDDGIEGNFTRKRTWWMENEVWAVYTC
jgi:hypothetical protein